MRHASRFAALIVAVAGALVLTTTSLAQATTYWVSKSGSDSNSCSTAQSSGGSAKLTINRGIQCMAGGDTLIIQNGTYDEKILQYPDDPDYFTVRPPSGSAGAMTIIKAQNVHGATLLPTLGVGTDNTRVIRFEDESQGHHIRFEGLRFTGATHMKSCVQSFTNDMEFVDIECDGMDFPLVFGGDRVTFTRLFVHNTGGGVTSSYGCGPSYGSHSYCHGMYGQTSGNGPIIIENSAFINNDGWGIQTYAAGITVRNSYFEDNYTGVFGCFAQGSPTPECQNVAVFYYNNVAVRAGQGIGGAPNWTAIHNTFVDIAGPQWVFIADGQEYDARSPAINGNCGSVVRNNLIYHMKSGVSPFGGCIASSTLGGNVCTESQSGCTLVSSGATFFMTSGTGYAAAYHTDPSSPAVNAGVSVGSPYNVDADGVSRPQGGGFDAGAFESGGSIPPPTPTALNFVQQPTTAAQNATITPSITVKAIDINGQVVTTYTGTITLTINTNPASGTLAGTVTRTAVSGVATFNNLSINNVGTGYRLEAASGSDPGLAHDVSTTFNITSVAAATALQFVAQPTNTMAGAAISPAVTVRVIDQFGQPFSSTATVAMAIGTNPASGTLTGTTSVAAVAGTASFSNLHINNAGVGYTLVASSSGLTSATSNAFQVVPAGGMNQVVVLVTIGGGMVP